MSNTSARYIANVDGRQEPTAFYFEITLAAIVLAGNVVNVDLPENAQIVSGAFTVDTAFNTTGADAVTIGDSAVANRYLASTSIKATSHTAFTLTGFKTTPTNNTLVITRTAADAAATTGVLRVYGAYVKLGRAETTQGA